MIRFIALIDLKPGYDPSIVHKVWDQLRVLKPPGTLAFTANFDFGIEYGVRDKAWTYGVVVDFVDIASFRIWHDHPARRPITSRIIPMIDRVARCLIEI